MGSSPFASFTMDNPGVATPSTAGSGETAATGAVPGVSAPSLVERIIVLTIQLGTGSFGDSGQNTLVLGSITDPKLCPRCSVHVKLAVAPYPGMAVITVYGLTIEHINQLTIAGILYDGRKNIIQVQAGDLKSGMSVVYTGEIWQAYPKASQPNMAFVILCNPANDIQLTPVSPTSFKGAIDGADVLKQIAQKAGLTLENNAKVSVILSNPYFANTAWEQFKACADAMGVTAMYDPVKKVLAVWPKRGNRGGNFLVSPDTGMIDYPEFQQAQVTVRQIFEPGNVPISGQRLEVRGSQFKAANGVWSAIYSCDLDISAQLPDGPWEVVITANRDPTGAASTPSPSALSPTPGTP